ncbi:MAG TPA: hypothetical protein VN890_08660 [Methylocella sp.]|nr:hypothetical protein [Methylocella sp.]
MTTKPKTRKAELDPACAAIAEHKALMKEWLRLSDELGEAESQARKTHGDRPSELIEWRNYRAIGEYGIDNWRKQLLSQPGADRQKVEKEYQDARVMLAAAERAAVEWDHHAGITPLREQDERARAAESRAAMRMAWTKPTTLAGAAALIAYTRYELIYIADSDWPVVALKTVAAALARMEAA